MSYNKILDRDIEKIKKDLIALVEATKSQYAKTFTILQSNDNSNADEVIMYDEKINDMQNDFSKMALWKIAKQQMVAGDLRLAIGGILISREIERIADYAKLICLFTKKYKTKSQELEHISDLFSLVNKMLNTISLLIENYEENQEKKVVEIEKKINFKFQEVNDVILNKVIDLHDDKNSIKKILALLRQLKNLERAGDHLINIEEILSFIRTGTFTEVKSIS